MVVGAAVLACGHDEGPYPTVTLSIRGQVVTAVQVPEPVAGATVGLWQFKGLSSSERIAHSTTDGTGSYQLDYAFTSICEESDRLLHWVEVSAEGYETATTFSNDDPNLPTWPSDPPIYCTNSPQTIDLAIQPFGTLRAITRSNGSRLDADGYLLRVGGEGPGAGGVHYPIALNEELIVPELRPGLHAWDLVEVAANCAVSGDNPRIVTVAPRQQTVSTFEVTCAP